MTNLTPFAIDRHSISLCSWDQRLLDACAASGFQTYRRPLMLLLHGFLEITYSRRKVIPALAEAGYNGVAQISGDMGGPPGGMQPMTATSLHSAYVIWSAAGSLPPRHRRTRTVHRRARRLGHLPISGAIERMQGTGCSAMRGVQLIDGAGHWVQ
jgi:hypothetical protein